jgi:hypothetical protein
MYHSPVIALNPGAVRTAKEFRRIVPARSRLDRGMNSDTTFYIMTAERCSP